MSQGPSQNGTVYNTFAGTHKQDGLQVGQDLMSVIVRSNDSVKAKLAEIAQNKSSVSVADMFEMQLMMNNFSQLCEMCTNVVAASNSASLSMIRNFKQ